MLNVVPWFSLLLTFKTPLWALTVLLTKGRPNPDPFSFVVKKGWKIFSKKSSSMPVPLSVISINAQSVPLYSIISWFLLIFFESVEFHLTLKSKSVKSESRTSFLVVTSGCCVEKWSCGGDSYFSGGNQFPSMV